MTAGPPDPNQKRVERVLEHSLEQIQTPESARTVIEKIEKDCSGQTEAGRAQEVEDQTAGSHGQPAAAAASIEVAADGAPSAEASVAEALETTAAQAVASTSAAPVVADAAQA